MRHTRIRLINFVSHIDTIINIEQVNACVCIGPNGAGKSSAMVDSFLLAVFGKGRKEGTTARCEMDDYVRIDPKTLLPCELMTIEQYRPVKVLKKYE